jgi:hypothetical protein
MKEDTGKNAETRIKLPSRDASPEDQRDLTLFEILNPGGDEIYKMSARYPTKPPLGPCTFRVFWKGGPFPANNVTISLVDIKHWVVVAIIASNIANVPPGEVGTAQWTIPAGFRPSDDCDTPAQYPDKYGRYQIYIEGGAPLTWTYGPEFAITWSE